MSDFLGRRTATPPHELQAAFMDGYNGASFDGPTTDVLDFIDRADVAQDGQYGAILASTDHGNRYGAHLLGSMARMEVEDYVTARDEPVSKESAGNFGVHTVAIEDIIGPFTVADLDS